MRYARTIAPTADPITLDEAKAHCNIAGTDEYDDYVAQLIGRAAAAIEKVLGRQIMPATWALSLDHFPDEILLGRPPVSLVSSIYYTDTAGVSTLLVPSQYQTDLSTPDGPARIKPAYGLTWPSTQSDKYGAVVVTFTAGYATQAAVPLALKHAVAFLVAHWFRIREPIITGTTIASISEGLDMLLSLEDWGGYA